MARYRGPVCKLCRREGQKLFLKGYKCYGGACILEKRNFVPGMHGRRRTKLSQYGEQLREKQKLRRIYGVFEKPFRVMFQKASKKAGITGDNLIKSLELRLDNIVYRTGISPARTTARMFVSHGHIAVNGRKVDIPSFQLKAGDVVEVRDRERSRKLAAQSLKQTESRIVPEWLALEREKFKVKVQEIPSRDALDVPINEQLIVELYSK